MTTKMTFNFDKKESIAINNLWFECFGEFTTIDSMDRIEIIINPKVVSNNEMSIITNNGNVEIELTLEPNDFIKILAGIETAANYMPSENVPTESIRQVIKNFHEVFGEEPKYRLCIDGNWMCKTHDSRYYDEGDEMEEIRKYYSTRLSYEGYDEDYIEEDLIDYASCHIYGSKLFMQMKRKGKMISEVFGENLNPFRNEAAEFNIENGSEGIELLRMEEEEYFRSIEEK